MRVGATLCAVIGVVSMLAIPQAGAVTVSFEEVTGGVLVNGTTLVPGEQATVACPNCGPADVHMNMIGTTSLPSPASFILTDGPGGPISDAIIVTTAPGFVSLTFYSDNANLPLSAQRYFPLWSNRGCFNLSVLT
jgi:hypothetical protein